MHNAIGRFSCFRSGSSLLGDLLSLNPSSSYYFEPFFQHKIFGKCHHRFNSSNVVNLIEEIVGGILNCEGKVINNLSKFSIRRRSLQCNETNISVIKTIRIHLNGVIPWVHKYPSLKVCFSVLLHFSSSFKANILLDYSFGT